MTQKQQNVCEENKYFLTSPIGNILISCCKDGLHCVKQSEVTTDEEFHPDINVPVELMPKDFLDSKTSRVAMLCLAWFKVYFKSPANTRSMNQLPICIASKEGTFRERVWLALAEHVKAGEVISYGKLAELLHNNGASRAVGSAMSNNPLQIVVPCHRVIKSNGALGNYAKGCRNSVKKWLLQHEGSIK